MLIERGADVSDQNKDGQTPLYLASQAGRLEVARMLIECGADVSDQIKDRPSRRPTLTMYMGFSRSPKRATSPYPLSQSGQKILTTQRKHRKMLRKDAQGWYQ